MVNRPAYPCSTARSVSAVATGLLKNSRTSYDSVEWSTPVKTMSARVKGSTPATVGYGRSTTIVWSLSPRWASCIVTIAPLLTDDLNGVPVTQPGDVEDLPDGHRP